MAFPVVLFQETQVEEQRFKCASDVEKTDLHSGYLKLPKGTQ